MYIKLSLGFLLGKLPGMYVYHHTYITLQCLEWKVSFAFTHGRLNGFQANFMLLQLWKGETLPFLLPNMDLISFWSLKSSSSNGVVKKCVSVDFPWKKIINPIFLISQSRFLPESSNSSKEGYEAIKSVELYLQFCFLHLVSTVLPTFLLFLK